MIRTADCVTAIIGHFVHTKDPVLTNPKNWKRRSKSQKCIGMAYGGDEKGNLVTRIFENTKTGMLVKISAGAQITEVIEVSNVTLSGMCRKILEDTDEGDSISGHSLINQLVFANLPQVENHDFMEDETKVTGHEDVDFENCELLGLTENSITIFAGGDWQEPLVFTMVMKDGELVYEGGAVKASSGNHPEMSDEKMLLALYGTKHPLELKGRRLPWPKNKEDKVI
jgi:hypothetical protein